MKRSGWVSALLAMLVSLAALSAPSAGGPPGDRAALSGLRSAKAVFDLRVADRERMIFNLELVRDTFEGLAAQRVRPRMIVAFRGPGVKFLAGSEAEEEIAPLVAELKRMGVRLEACSIATRMFKVDESKLLPDVVLVGNGIASLIGYQNRGYALVTLN